MVTPAVLPVVVGAVPTDGDGGGDGGPGGFGGGGGGAGYGTETSAGSAGIGGGAEEGDEDGENGGCGGGGAGLLGGGVSNYYGTITITNSTLSGNIAMGGQGDTTYRTGADGIGFGGGLFDYYGTVTVNNATFSNNTANTGGGLFTFHSEMVTIANSILAHSTAFKDCFNNSSLVISVNNLMESNVGCGTPVSTNDPNLAPLADNGGPTWTHALLDPSDAIDGGDNSSCENRDQRGSIRPKDGNRRQHR